MPDEVTTTEAVTKTSDGSVKISVEKYNELLETIANQKTSIADFRARLTKAMNEPPVVHRTIVNKTPEMLSQEHRAWGGTFMGLGASLFVVGALRYKAGREA
jgi:hypothetical protein